MPRRPRNRKRENYLRKTGRGLTVEGEDKERIIHRIRSFHARGMTYVQIGRQVGVPERTVTEMARIGRGRITRRVWEPLSRLEFEEPDAQARVGSTGPRRRLEALWAEGYPLPWVAEQLPFGDRRYLQSVVRGFKAKGTMAYAHARAIAELYDKLEGCTPDDLGLNARSVNFARAFATKRGSATRGCWDPDTIDDPEAIPDWTGRCGTPFGYILHRRESIPLCEPCRKAYTGNPYPGFSGELLRQLRERRGMSRPALAASLNLNPATIQYWETGRNLPTRQFKLDEALNVLDGTYEDVCEEA